MKNTFFYIVFLLVVLVCPTYGQAQTKGFERIINDKISDSGNVVTFFSKINNQVTLIAKDIKRNKSYKMSNIVAQTVLTEDYLVTFNFYNKQLYILNFENSKIDTITNVSAFESIGESQRIIIDRTAENRLELRDLKKNKRWGFSDVKKYFFSQDKMELFVVNKKNEIRLVDVTNGMASTIMSRELDGLSIKGILTSKNNSAAYIMAHDRKELSIFELKNKRINHIFNRPLLDSETKSAIDTLFYKTLLMDSSHIAITVKKADDRPLSNKELQIWRGRSKKSESITDQQIRANDQLALIDLKNKKWINFFSDKSKEFRINQASQTIYGFEWNEDLSKQFPKIGLYQFDKNNEKLESVGVFNGAHYNYFQTSRLPYLFYFKNKDWYYYDPQKKQHNNITEKSEDVFFNKENEYAEIKEDEGYQNFGIMDDNSLIFHGFNDVWQFDTKQKKLVKRTRGKEEYKRYTVQDCNFLSTPIQWSWNYEKVAVGYKNLLLKWVSEDYKQEGLSLLSKSGNFTPLLSNKSQIIQIQRSENYITYIKEAVNLTPTLYRFNIQTLEEQPVYQSNRWDTVAKELKSEYVQWKNEKGENRAAVVRYPINYNKLKKYPAIFFIYEKRYNKQHYYTSPYQIISGEINRRTYMDDGYFVIEPDIYFEMGNTGRSAFENVNDVADKLCKEYGIDKNNLGLFGHSFGGYETNFIITQSSLFKAAVSSAGVADLNSFYLTVNWETLKPDMWRMEQQQWRLGKGMFDAPDSYMRSSPMSYISQVTTPLLLITGKEDYQINWQQSVMMYVALKRLGKEVNLLLYPNEGHVLMNPENQKDAEFKMKSWFDFYLKNKEEPSWLIEGLP
ncbi:alpha/beta hydrolase family protein [Flavobacterium sp. JP2137]|uniref:alpha/beta hydrolase family protein n=1 Tax=Flavobacterium sp. JP2137 TaxID=3414510 RepID=UPI003D2FA2AA